MGADFLQKYPLVAGTPVTIDADESIVAFDFTNDSPLDVDIQWRQGGPVALTVPPEMVWRGVKPSAALLISGNKRSGRVIATPSIPQGGSPPGGAPAKQLTVHGYVKGNEPPELITPLNRLASIGNQVSTGQIYNAILECFAGLDISQPNGTLTTVPLTASRLNLAGVSIDNPGYLLLNYLFWDNNTTYRKRTFEPRKESVFPTAHMTVPGSTSGNVQAFSFLDMMYLKQVRIFNFPGNFTITRVRVKRDQDAAANYIDMLSGNITTQTFVEVGTHFDNGDGFTNLAFQDASHGFTVEITANNTAAGAQGVDIGALGSKMVYDDATFAFSYVDWQNNVYDIGSAVIFQSQLLPLSMLIPIPITDPGQTNFGSMLFELVDKSFYYDPNYLAGIFIPCAITFLAPG